MTYSTTEAPTAPGGGFPTPAPRSATVTLTDRHGARLTVSTWDVCAGVSALVAMLLGSPTARAETTTNPPHCQGDAL